MMVPAPGEPSAGPWHAVPNGEFAAEMIASASHSGADRVVIAVDGRSGSGKTSLARRLVQSLPNASMVSADDISWNESLFGWSDLAIEGVIGPFRAGGLVQYRPRAWEAHGRPGTVDIPATASVLIFEGVGASQRVMGEAIDAAVWVQSDFKTAETRGIARDIASGVNGDEAESVAFWHAWMAQELPFIDHERSWERADAIVAGNSTAAVDPRSVTVAWPGGVRPEKQHAPGAT